MCLCLWIREYYSERSVSSTDLIIDFGNLYDEIELSGGDGGPFTPSTIADYGAFRQMYPDVEAPSSTSSGHALGPWRPDLLSTGVQHMPHGFGSLPPSSGLDQPPLTSPYVPGYGRYPVTRVSATRPVYVTGTVAPTYTTSSHYGVGTVSAPAPAGASTLHRRPRMSLAGSQVDVTALLAQRARLDQTLASLVSAILFYCPLILKVL